MTAVMKKNSLKKTDTQTFQKTDTQTSAIVTKDSSLKKTEVNEAGKTILKPVKPLDPVDTTRIIPYSSTVSTKDIADSKVDDVIAIARKVAESKPANFDLVFEMAMKVYIMATFRSSNNMAIEVSA